MFVIHWSVRVWATSQVIFPATASDLILEEFQIDPGLFLLIFPLFVFDIGAFNAGGQGPCHEAPRENQKEAT